MKWMEHFENNFPAIVKRPLVLVYYGYSSHYNYGILDRDIELSIILGLLLDNSTHLIQPLDIVLLKPPKTILKWTMDNSIIDRVCTALSKKYALEITLEAW